MQTPHTLTHILPAARGRVEILKLHTLSFFLFFPFHNHKQHWQARQLLMGRHPSVWARQCLLSNQRVQQPPTLRRGLLRPWLKAFLSPPGLLDMHYLCGWHIEKPAAGDINAASRDCECTLTHSEYKGGLRSGCWVRKTYCETSMLIINSQIQPPLIPVKTHRVLTLFLQCRTVHLHALNAISVWINALHLIVGENPEGETAATPFLSAV